MSTARQQYIENLTDAWKDGVCTCDPAGNCTCGGDALKTSIPDSHKVTVSMMALDSVQQQIATEGDPYDHYCQRVSDAWKHPAGEAA